MSAENNGESATNSTELSVEQREAQEPRPLWRQEEVSAALWRHVEGYLMRHLLRGHHLFMENRGLGIFIWSGRGEAPVWPPVGGDSSRDPPPVALLSTLQCVLKSSVRQVLGERPIGLRDQATLPFILLSACPPLRDLLMDERGGVCPIDVDPAPEEWRATAAHCLDAASRRDRIEADCLDHIMRAVIQRREALGNPALTRFEGRGDGIWMCWSSGDGRILHEERLQAFVNSISGSLTEHVLRFAQEPGLRELMDRGVSILRRVSPPLAEMVEDVWAHGLTTGRRLAVTAARQGIPLHIWLYLTMRYPTVGAPACILSADRAHGDFVLEAEDGSLFYFPPCVLSARLVFDGKKFLVESPRIREPANGYPWRHPYTGDLGADAFAAARVTKNEEEAMVRPSEWALKTFPLLGSRTPQAGENDMCLSDQDQAVRAIAVRLDEELAAGAPSGLTHAVTALHNLAKIGLTTAHQDNTARPRVPLSAEGMLYPVPRCVLPDSRGARVFRYAARRRSTSPAQAPRVSPPPVPSRDDAPPRRTAVNARDWALRLSDSGLRRFLSLQ